MGKASAGERVEVILYQNGKGVPSPCERVGQVYRSPIFLSMHSLDLAERLFPEYMKASYRVGGK